MKKRLGMIIFIALWIGVSSVSFALTPDVDDVGNGEVATAGDLIWEYASGLNRVLTAYTPSIQSDSAIKLGITNIIRILDGAMTQKELNSAIPASLKIFKPIIDAHDTTKVPLLITELERLLEAHARAIIRVNDKTSQTSYAVQTLDELRYIKSGDPVNDFAIDSAVTDASSALAFAIGTEVSSVIISEPNRRTLTIETNSMKQTSVVVRARLDLFEVAYKRYLGQFQTGRLPKRLTLAVTVPKDKIKLSVVLQSGLASILKEQWIDELAVTVNGTKVIIPISEMANDQESQFNFEFLYNMDAKTGIENTLSPERQKDVFINGQSVDITYTVNGVLKDTFTHPIQLSFQLSQFLFEGELNVDELAVFRYNPARGLWEAVGGLYDPISGTLTVNRMSLSQYTVLKTKLVFNDVANSNSKDAINKLLNKGILTPEATFLPQENITRETFVSWIAQAYGLENRSSRSPFLDVLISNRYQNNIIAVFTQGIINGKTSTHFDPKGTITKQEMAKIISNSLVAYNHKLRSTALTEKLLSSRTAVASWAKDDVALLMSLGLMNEEDLKTLNQPVTKEAAAVLLSKIYN